MIDKKHIGYAPPTTLWEVEKGRIAFFAKVIGACDPIHTDEAAAKAAGYRAICVTVDRAYYSRRERDIINGYLQRADSGDPRHQASLTWEDAAWIKQHTKLPLILKGIATAEDAKLAVEHGAECCNYLLAVDVENNTVYYSPRWRKMLGYDEHDVKVTPDWRRLVHPDDLAMVLERHRKGLAGEPVPRQPGRRLEQRCDHPAGAQSASRRRTGPDRGPGPEDRGQEQGADRPGQQAHRPQRQGHRPAGRLLRRSRDQLQLQCRLDRSRQRGDAGAWRGPQRLHHLDLVLPQLL